jgi:hypothetical protein
MKAFRTASFFVICLVFITGKFGSRAHASVDPSCDALPAHLDGGNCGDLANPDDFCDAVCGEMNAEFWELTDCDGMVIGQAEDCEDGILYCSCWPDDLPSGHQPGLIVAQDRE